MQTATVDAILPDIRLIATDMDGTLTHQEEFSHRLLVMLEKLRSAGMPVMITTGRSAGWVSGLAHYLPVVGASAENGGVYFKKANGSPIILQSIGDLKIHRQKLQTQFETLRSQFPQLQESTDNCFRLTDWTFDVEGLSADALDWMTQHCYDNGWGFTYSTVQCHIKPLVQDKATGLLQVLQQQFPGIAPDQVLTIGDSPNDESLFDPARFPHSVGVANVRHYLERLAYQPAYVTQAEAGDGFCELTEQLLKVIA